MKEVLQRRLWQELGKEDSDQDKIDRLAKALFQLNTPLERDESEQIYQAAVARIHAKNPPPKTLYL